ncbi:polysaccharide deacetylase family protein [Luteolibacter sp. LG18]|uniref:polysaccharide deacetylase family protein n=1 Tax=Luteolibacter sp. LG18 TaxID=2819286 RepID=UPI0030C6C0EB
MKRLSLSLTLVLLSAGLGSCTVDKAADAGRFPNGPAAPVKTTRNTAYQTPPVQGPVRRNPDMNLSSNFPKGTSISYSRVNVAGKYIAITFDDGPHASNTPRLLDMLRARNIKATFFCVGQNVAEYPQICRQIVAEGHEIANHSWNHPLLTKLSDAQYHDQITKTHEAIIRATGVTPHLLRPPYGALTQRQREWAYSEYGYPTVLWSVDPFDWKRPGAAAVTSRILSGTTPGGIILAHDIHAQTIDAMPATLDTLLSRGYKFVTVSQLLAMQQAAPAPAPAQAPAAPAPVAPAP